MFYLVEAEEKEIRKIERQHCKKKRLNTYIALENLNFNWDLKQVEMFQEMWKSGSSIIELAEFFERSQEEIGLLIIDRSLKDKIKPRKGGLFGNGM